MTSFSGNDGDFFEAWRALTYGTGGTRENKRLPPAPAAPDIPARSGTAPPVTQPASTGGGVDMTLKGAKTYVSTDGLVTFSFPQSAEVVVGATTITLPAIIKTP